MRPFLPTTFAIASGKYKGSRIVEGTGLSWLDQPLSGTEAEKTGNRYEVFDETTYRR
jgi:hypothetical protein